MTLAAMLKHKGCEVIGVDPTRTVTEVIEVLSSRGIGAVVVWDSAHQLLGIISERDIVNSLAVDGARTLEMTAGQLMTRSVKTATPQTTEAEAMTMMTSGRFRHLPVLENGVLIGIVSIGDAVKARVMQTEQDVDSLRSYVAHSA
jgi:CBS domain-containing protein